ncbi:M20 family peptidase [Labedella phragmitis]|uniref:M20 family peptidase n=1 Tax=Labedella phragmitis TaxID=2498849 RepID=A0A444PRM6_9MICO|nr:M20 family metallopeptidase [Labedella phragmitis]RWZ49907.1 M20 family peptidase [Labedella phragmitis]
MTGTDDYLDRHDDALLALTARLIGIDSQIPPFGDERAIIAHLDGVLERDGFTERTIMEPVRGRPSLIARIPGVGGGPTLMFCAHVDTKPVGDAAGLWRTDPFTATIVDDRIVGLGATDMKGALAAMILAVRAVRASSALRGDLVLTLVADEEAGAGAGAKRVAPTLRDAGIDAAIIGEPSGWTRDWQAIHLVSRGILAATVVVRGTQKHSGLSDRLPTVNAALVAAGLMQRAVAELRFPTGVAGSVTVAPTVNVGATLATGAGFGVTPGRAEFGIEVRTVPGATPASVRKVIDAWLDGCRRDDPSLDAEIVLHPGLEWLPWSVMSDDHPLVEVVRRASADVLGEAPPFDAFPGGTDAPWFAAAGIPTLPAFGPGMLSSAHGPNEFVSLSSLRQAARMYARIMQDYCGVA